MSKLTEKQSKYLDKSGDEKIFTKNMVENSHGFYSYSIDGDVLNIGNVFGDGRYWEEFTSSLCEENKCKTIRFATRRNPEAWARKYNYKIVGHILEKRL
jgi:hypothetical protein